MAVEHEANAKLTHLKGHMSAYAYRLQPTHHTALEETITTATVCAPGAMEMDGKPGTLNLLIEKDEIIDNEEFLWHRLKLNEENCPFILKLSYPAKR